MPDNQNDLALFERIRTSLGTPVVGDVCDRLGRYHQCLPPEIRPLNPAAKLVGRAMPVLMSDTFVPPQRLFGRLTDALDQLEAGEIYITSGGLQRSAYWGEILTLTSRMRGANGAVIDGWHRDTNQVVDQDWPVFSRGAFAQDSGARTKVDDFRVPIEIGGVSVQAGQLIIADIDGIVVVPLDLEEEIIQLALEKASAEKVVLNAISEGMSSTDAWATFGVL